VTTSSDSFSVGNGSVQLAGLDYGGTGPHVLLLHGLAGTALEWGDTASWLRETHHVVAPDQRGHGGSERHPPSVSPDDLVGDVLTIVERFGARRVGLIGQSFGAQTAFLAAARRPDVVSALIVAEASPAPTDKEAVEELRACLGSWPLPFPSREDAAHFFGGETVAARAWAAGLEERDRGLWPAFDAEVVVRTLAECVDRDYWSEWTSIEAPTLIVRAERGWISAAEVEEMRTRLPRSRLVEVPGAGHDVHLEAPHEWRRAVASFLASVPAQ
jgi:pimeloyl-ACP methyl ester carboxylesterase